MVKQRAELFPEPLGEVCLELTPDSCEPLGQMLVDRQPVFLDSLAQYSQVLMLLYYII